MNTYNWTIPDDPNKSCVLRIRYNISTNDFAAWDTNVRDNGEEFEGFEGLKGEGANSFPVCSNLRDPEDIYIKISKHPGHEAGEGVKEIEVDSWGKGLTLLRSFCRRFQDIDTVSKYIPTCDIVE